MAQKNANRTILETIYQARRIGRKLFVVLIDPDKTNSNALTGIIQKAEKAGVDLFFVGGSLMMENELARCLDTIRAKSDIPSILFPGNPIQLNDKADALLFLSLISGRNSEFLIGNHVIAAPFLKQSSLEIMPTGYMLIDGGAPTTVSYISNTFPIPADKPEIAMATAIAGEMLGLKLLYMDAGSGAKNAITPEMIALVRKAVDLPIIIGGGIRTTEQAAQAAEAGADIIVVGNQLEENPELVYEMAKVVHSFNLPIERS